MGEAHISDRSAAAPHRSRTRLRAERHPRRSLVRCRLIAVEEASITTVRPCKEEGTAAVQDVHLKYPSSWTAGAKRGADTAFDRPARLRTAARASKRRCKSGAA